LSPSIKPIPLAEQPRGKQRTDSTHVLAAVRTMNCLERVGETLRAALNSLAVAWPEWLTKIADRERFQRYGRRIANVNLPKAETARTQLAAEIGADGKKLLRVTEGSKARAEFIKLDAGFSFAASVGGAIRRGRW
jgi:transposase